MRRHLPALPALPANRKSNIMNLSSSLHLASSVSFHGASSGRQRFFCGVDEETGSFTPVWYESGSSNETISNRTMCSVTGLGQGTKTIVYGQIAGDVGKNSGILLAYYTASGRLNTTNVAWTSDFAWTTPNPTFNTTAVRNLSQHLTTGSNATRGNIIVSRSHSNSSPRFTSTIASSPTSSNSNAVAAHNATTLIAGPTATSLLSGSTFILSVKSANPTPVAGGVLITAASSSEASSMSAAGLVTATSSEDAGGVTSILDSPLWGATQNNGGMGSETQSESSAKETTSSALGRRASVLTHRGVVLCALGLQMLVLI
ncbi:hypothetical protein P7C70_g2624, partial [Phenoliferia sp. Uapishka_3]